MIKALLLLFLTSHVSPITLGLDNPDISDFVKLYENSEQPFLNTIHKPGNRMRDTIRVTNKKHKNAYYGRVHVQLTCDRNHKKIGMAIGLNDK